MTEQKEETKYVAWDGKIASLMQLINDMLAESGVTDRKFVAENISSSKLSIKMEFPPCAS